MSLPYILIGFQNELLNVLKDLNNKDIFLWVVGDGPDRKRYEEYCKNNNLLKKLENMLNEEIIGQEEVIKILCFETKKLKLGLKNTCRPLSFLFTNPDSSISLSSNPCFFSS